MRPVEPPPPRVGNPGASRNVRRRRDAGASAAISPNEPCGRGESAGSGWPPRAGPRHAPGASRAGRSSGCRGRSGCTAPPARGSVRTGTGGPDGPCAHPGRTEGAGRTRPGAPDLPGTAFIGTVWGAARSSSLPAREDRCRAHLLRLRSRLYRGRAPIGAVPAVGTAASTSLTLTCTALAAAHSPSAAPSPAGPPCRAARQASDPQPQLLAPA